MESQGDANVALLLSQNALFISLFFKYWANLPANRKLCLKIWPHMLLMENPYPWVEDRLFFQKSMQILRDWRTGVWLQMPTSWRYYRKIIFCFLLPWFRVSYKNWCPTVMEKWKGRWHRLLPTTNTDFSWGRKLFTTWRPLWLNLCPSTSISRRGCCKIWMNSSEDLICHLCIIKTKNHCHSVSINGFSCFFSLEFCIWVVEIMVHVFLIRFTPMFASLLCEV